MKAAGYIGGMLGVGIEAMAAPYRKVRLDIVTGKFVFLDDLTNTGVANEDEKVVKFFSSSYNSKDSKLYLYINDELQCILKKETWFRYSVTNTGDTILLTVVSENGFRTTKTIINQSVNAEVYLIIDKKRKVPLVNKVYSQKVRGIENMMIPKNSVYKDAESHNTLK